jgi:hypothetical protein
MRLYGFLAASLLLGAWMAPTSQPNPCSLLTAAEVSTALGTSVTADASMAPQACAWAPAGGPIGAKTAMLTMMTPEQFANDKNPPVKMANVKTTSVSGLGDDALSFSFGNGSPSLDVKKGNSAFQIGVTGLPAAQANQVEQTLAKQVLKRL